MQSVINFLIYYMAIGYIAILILNLFLNKEKNGMLLVVYFLWPIALLFAFIGKFIKFDENENP